MSSTSMCLLRLYKPSLCVSAASEAGLLPSARLGSIPDEAPRRTLQEHDRPSGNQLPGPQIAPQGLPAWLLPVAATSAAVHTPPPALQGALGGGGVHLFFFFFLLSFSTVRTSSCLLPLFLLLSWMWKQAPFLSSPSLLPQHFLSSVREEWLPRWSSSTAASYSVNGLSLFSSTWPLITPEPFPGIFIPHKKSVSWYDTAQTALAILDLLSLLPMESCVCLCVRVPSYVGVVYRDNESSRCKRTQENKKEN